MTSGIHLTKGSEIPKFPEDGQLRLYSMKFCPFAQRAHLVLEAKKIPYHTAFIDLTEKPEWLVQITTTLKVPALEIPGEAGDALIESLIISDYLDEKYGKEKLHPEDPLKKAHDRILVERFNSVIGPFFRLFYYQADDAKSKILPEYLGAWDFFETELKKRGTKFFGGEKPGMLDYMIWPFGERSDMLPLVFGSENELDEKRFSSLISWKTAMKLDSAVKAVYISGEHHVQFRNFKIQGQHPDYNFLA